MSADKLLDEIAERGWLAGSILERVRQKVSGRSVDAESICRFLVDKGHLTQNQVDDLLDAAAVEPLVEPLDFAEAGGDGLEGPTAASGSAGAPASTAAEQATDELDDGAGPKAERRRREKRRRPKKNANEWDSPLMLIGGGALVLLLMCGAGVYFLLLRGSGDDLLRVAQEEFDKASYSQAISQYERFLEDFPAHDGSGLARVNLGLARIRQALEASGDFEMALDRSNSEIPEMMRTDEVEYAQNDLSALLPRIASGLVEEADAAVELADINRYVDLTNTALDLSMNTKYVPSQKRNRPELERVQEVLSRISRRQESLEALVATLSAMRSAVASGDVRPAYEAHAALLKSRPELGNKPELTEAIAAAVVAEQGAVGFVEAVIDAETSERPSPVAAVVATADQRRAGSAPARGFAVFDYQGVLYGFRVSDGRLLWRRRVGDGLSPARPLMGDGVCFAIDEQDNELISLDAESGRLNWRTPLGEELRQPQRLDDRLFVPSTTGRLHVLDAASGRRLGYVQFAQPLLSAPAVAEDGSRLYLVGEHSSVYSLAADSLECLGVYYLGHAKRSVVAPPATVLGRVLVAENDGLSTSTLHVLAVDERGAIEREAEQIKLKGLSPGEPIVFGRRLAAVTDTGQITVFEASPEDPMAPLSELAARRPPRRSPTQRFAALVDRHFWVAGRGLAKYSIAPAGNRLPISEVQEPFRDDVFTGPLVVRGDVLLHARRRRGQPGVTVAATDTKTGLAYWETDIAAPPAGPPRAAVDRSGVTQTVSTGRVYRASTEPTGGVAYPNASTSADAGSAGRGVLFGTATVATGSNQLVTSEGSDTILRVAGNGVSALAELPDRVACEPTAFADGWLTTLTVGQVFYVDADPARQPATPFHPESPAGKAQRWLPAGVGMVRGERTAVLTNGEQIYSLQLFDGEPRRLEVISESPVEVPLSTRVAVAHGFAVAGRDDGRLSVYDAESLDLVAESGVSSSNPGSAIDWGPYAVGSIVLVADVAGGLRCYDLTEAPAGELTPIWAASLPVGRLIGPPVGRG
ncbi:MAG: PQQ-binding-like beta-propeller repeat protein, partial [Planctomycetota bacterium]